MEKKDKRESVALVGDVGATYARFALLRESSPGRLHPEISDIQVLQTKAHASLEGLIAHYLTLTRLPRTPRRGCIAVAGVVDGDSVYMPNPEWRFSAQALQTRLGCETLLWINDLAAQAWNIPETGPEALLQIGGGKRDEKAPFVLIGPGSGLGIAGGAPSSDGLMVIASEGGHAGFAPQDAMEIDIFRYLLNIFGRVSNERLLSGPGIENIHRAISHFHGVEEKSLSAAEITERAVAGVCPICRETLQVFFSVLGGVAGDIALIMGGKGGVFITGGIVPRLADLLKTSSFRNRFEEKGRFESYLKQVPVFIVKTRYPGLEGSAAVFRNTIILNKR